MCCHICGSCRAMVSLPVHKELIVLCFCLEILHIKWHLSPHTNFATCMMWVFSWVIWAQHASGIISINGACARLHLPMHSRRWCRLWGWITIHAVQHKVWRARFCILDHARSSRVLEHMLGLSWSHRRIVTKHESQDTTHVRACHGRSTHRFCSLIILMRCRLDRNTWPKDVQARAIVTEGCPLVLVVCGAYSDGRGYIGRREVASIGIGIACCHSNDDAFGNRSLNPRFVRL